MRFQRDKVRCCLKSSVSAQASRQVTSFFFFFLLKLPTTSQRPDRASAAHFVSSSLLGLKQFATRSVWGERWKSALFRQPLNHLAFLTEHYSRRWQQIFSADTLSCHSGTRRATTTTAADDNSEWEEEEEEEDGSLPLECLRES